MPLNLYLGTKFAATKSTILLYDTKTFGIDYKNAE